MLDLCKGNDLFIINGRIGNDKGIGKLTCKNSSVVDYVISSVDFLKHIANFSICQFSKLFSDVHSPISLSLKSENKDEIMVTENVSNNAEACREKPKKWDETYKIDFVNSIDVDSIQNLDMQLENLNIENVVQSDINTLVGKIGEIYVSSAKETFGIAGKPFKNKKRKVCIGSKPWFGVDCKFARQHYRKLKQRCKTNNTEEKRELIKKAEKDYKKQMDVGIKNIERK